MKTMNSPAALDKIKSAIDKLEKEVEEFTKGLGLANMARPTSG